MMVMMDHDGGREMMMMMVVEERCGREMMLMMRPSICV